MLPVSHLLFSPSVVMDAREHPVLLAECVIHARHIDIVAFENLVRLEVIVAPISSPRLIRQRIILE